MSKTTQERFSLKREWTTVVLGKSVKAFGTQHTVIYGVMPMKIYVREN